jgi:hypothetical protein
MITSHHSNENESELSRKAAGTGSLILSSFVGGALGYQANDPRLGFAVSGFFTYLVTRRVILSFKRRFEGGLR